MTLVKQNSEEETMDPTDNTKIAFSPGEEDWVEVINDANWSIENIRRSRGMSKSDAEREIGKYNRKKIDAIQQINTIRMNQSGMKKDAPVKDRANEHGGSSEMRGVWMEQGEQIVKVEYNTDQIRIVYSSDDEGDSTGREAVWKSTEYSEQGFGSWEGNGRDYNGNQYRKRYYEHKGMWSKEGEEHNTHHSYDRGVTERNVRRQPGVEHIKEETVGGIDLGEAWSSSLPIKHDKRTGAVRDEFRVKGSMREVEGVLGGSNIGECETRKAQLDGCNKEESRDYNNNYEDVKIPGSPVENYGRLGARPKLKKEKQYVEVNKFKIDIFYLGEEASRMERQHQYQESSPYDQEDQVYNKGYQSEEGEQRNGSQNSGNTPIMSINEDSAIMISRAFEMKKEKENRGRVAGKHERGPYRWGRSSRGSRSSGYTGIIRDKNGKVFSPGQVWRMLSYQIHCEFFLGLGGSQVVEHIINAAGLNCPCFVCTTVRKDSKSKHVVPELRNFSITGEYAYALNEFGGESNNQDEDSREYIEMEEEKSCAQGTGVEEEGMMEEEFCRNISLISVLNMAAQLHVAAQVLDRTEKGQEIGSEVIASTVDMLVGILEGVAIEEVEDWMSGEPSKLKKMPYDGNAAGGDQSVMDEDQAGAIEEQNDNEPKDGIDDEGAAENVVNDKPKKVRSAKRLEKQKNRMLQFHVRMEVDRGMPPSRICQEIRATCAPAIPPDRDGLEKENSVRKDGNGEDIFYSDDDDVGEELSFKTGISKEYEGSNDEDEGARDGRMEDANNEEGNGRGCAGVEETESRSIGPNDRI